MHGNNKELAILLEQFQNGDQKAFEEIYKRCYGHIAFVCSKLCDNKEDIEEIVQDTFMAAFKKAHELRGSTFLGLLRKIAANECYHKRKKNQREPVLYLEDATDTEAEELDLNFLPEEYLQNKEIQAYFLRMVNSLSPRQRSAVYMYYYVGLSTEEIARLEGCSASNIRKSLSVARDTMKRKIEGRTKHKFTQRLAGAGGVSISTALLMEEASFAATYVGTATLGTAAAVTTATTTSYTSAIVATCITVAVAVSAIAYIALQPNEDVYKPHEPPQQVESVIPEPPPQQVEVYEITEAPEVTYEPTPQPIEESEPEPEPVVYEPYRPEAPEEIYEPYEPYQPYEFYEPYESYEPESELEEAPEPEPVHAHVDRTPQIIAALEIATTLNDVNSIITYYGFALVTQIQDLAEDALRFYVLDDGSGDILIGTSATEFRFEHYNNSSRPTDTLDLLFWMEG